MKKLLATLTAIVLSGAIAFGANLPLITGPTPAADLQFFLNQLIQSINSGVGGLLNSQTAAVSSGALSSEQVLQTYTLPANSLTTAGQSVRATCWGTTSNDAATKMISLYFGASRIATGAFPGATTWSLTEIVMRRTATTQGYDGTGQQSAAASQVLNTWPVVTDAAETLTSGVVIKCTAQHVNTAGLATANGMITEVLK